MRKHLVSINDLPPDGKEFELVDPDIWLEPIREFKMDCRILEPLHGKVFVQPVDEGILIRGELQGKVAVPCNRCAEDASVKIDAEFNEYEDIPSETGAKDDEQEGCIIYERHAPMLNLAEIGWEQFMLAMPVQPLCRPDCRGLCPHCGVNLNMNECSCQNDAGDPRMAALRNVTVDRK